MESIPAHIAHRVTAVCYRRSDAGVKLLLVRSSAGRWTLPKGGVEKGELQADAAAREAREEAGVRGSDYRPDDPPPRCASPPRGGHEQIGLRG